MGSTRRGIRGRRILINPQGESPASLENAMIDQYTNDECRGDMDDVKKFEYHHLYWINLIQVVTDYFGSMDQASLEVKDHFRKLVVEHRGYMDDAQRRLFP